jgi:hypothetical protein
MEKEYYEQSKENGEKEQIKILDNEFMYKIPFKNEIETLVLDKITIDSKDICNLRKLSKSNEKNNENQTNYNMEFSIEDDNYDDSGSDQNNNSDIIKENNTHRIYYNTFNKDLHFIREENEENIESRTNLENNNLKRINNQKNDFLEYFDPNDKSNDYRVKRIQTIQTIKEGILKKKSPWFHYNTRKVILDSSPRIEYIDPVLNRVKVNRKYIILGEYLLK